MQTQSRRSFYIAATNLLGGMMAAALALPAATYLLLKPKGRNVNGDWTDVGDVTTLSSKIPREVLYNRKWMDGWKKVDEKTTIWLMRTDENTVVAYNAACTHFGCNVHWEEPKKVFRCPCHDSVFSIDGDVISGPAPRALHRYETKVEEGRILIGPTNG